MHAWTTLKCESSKWFKCFSIKLSNNLSSILQLISSFISFINSDIFSNEVERVAQLFNNNFYFI